MEDYSLRRDIDKFKYFLDQLEAVLVTKYNIGDLNLEEMFDNFYDKSEIEELLNPDWETVFTEEQEGVTGLLESKGINARFTITATDISLTTSYTALFTISGDWVGYFPEYSIYGLGDGIKFRITKIVEEVDEEEVISWLFEIMADSSTTEDILCVLEWTI